MREKYPRWRAQTSGSGTLSGGIAILLVVAVYVAIRRRAVGCGAIGRLAFGLLHCVISANWVVLRGEVGVPGRVQVMSLIPSVAAAAILSGVRKTSDLAAVGQLG